MKICLKLSNKLNEAFLRMKFSANKTGPIRIERKDEIGKYISSRVRYSNLPVNSEGTELILPKTTLESGNNYFLYFSIEDQRKINDYLTAQFNIFFHNFMFKGNSLGIKKKVLIESMISQLNLKNDSTIFDNLKKNDYRLRKKIENFISETVQTPNT